MPVGRGCANASGRIAIQFPSMHGSGFQVQIGHRQQSDPGRRFGISYSDRDRLRLRELGAKLPRPAGAIVWPACLGPAAERPGHVTSGRVTCPRNVYGPRSFVIRMDRAGPGGPQAAVTGSSHDRRFRVSFRLSSGSGPGLARDSPPSVARGWPIRWQNDKPGPVSRSPAAAGAPSSLKLKLSTDRWTFGPKA